MADLRAAVIAHAEACGLALAEMRPRPEWTGGSLLGANLRGANLRDATLRDADLRGANLRGANLRDAYLLGADLLGADLSDANLRDADLRGANLRGANLRDADLRGANLLGADLRGADLSDTIKVTAGRFRAVGGGTYAAWTAAAEGGRVLRFGCELRTVADWRANLAALCQKHEPIRAAEFIAEIGAILDYCDALDRLDAADAGGAL